MRRKRKQAKTFGVSWLCSPLVCHKSKGNEHEAYSNVPAGKELPENIRVNGRLAPDPSNGVDEGGAEFKFVNCHSRVIRAFTVTCIPYLDGGPVERFLVPDL